MLESAVYTARSFAEFYRISRERLGRILNEAMRDHAGVFALEGYGFFRAEKTDPKRMEIHPYHPTRVEEESIRPFALSGKFMPRAAAPHPTSFPPAQSGQPTEHELKLRLTQARIDQLNQKNVLEQARLRSETVAYCSEVFQLLLSDFRSELDSLRLDPVAASSIREALLRTLSDMDAVVPDIIAGVPVDRIELNLSSRRASRLAASRAASSASNQTTEPTETTA
jgi:hypothetical protein